jgi:hypothetical protein
MGAENAGARAADPGAAIILDETLAAENSADTSARQDGPWVRP